MTPPTRLASAMLVMFSWGAAEDARAAWDCTDSWGNRYLVDRPFGEKSGVRCHQAGEDRSPRDAPSKAARVLDVSRSAAPLQSSPAKAAPPALTSMAALLWEPDPPQTALRPPGTEAGRRGRLVLSDVDRAERVAWFEGARPLSRSLRRVQYDPLIESVARHYGHDPNLLRAIVHHESGFNPRAVSPAGAIGLMQVMPATAGRFGLKDAHKNLFEPEVNLRIGAEYLSVLLRLFSGRLDLSVAAYNAGEGAVLRYKRQIPPYPETRAYVANVLATYRALASKP